MQIFVASPDRLFYRPRKGNRGDQIAIAIQAHCLLQADGPVVEQEQPVEFRISVHHGDDCQALLARGCQHGQADLARAIRP